MVEKTKKELKQEARDAYDEVICSTWADYEKVKAPAWKAFKKVEVPAWEACKKRLAEIEEKGK